MRLVASLLVLRVMEPYGMHNILLLGVCRYILSIFPYMFFGLVGVVGHICCNLMVVVGCNNIHMPF